MQGTGASPGPSRTSTDATTDESSHDTEGLIGKDSSDFAADIEAASDSATQAPESSLRPSLENVEPLPEIPTILAEDGTQSPSEALSELQKRFEELEKDRAEATTTHHEEVQGHLERIDALQAKLKYLAEEATKTALNVQQDAAEADPDSLGKQLAAKDEKIAALMEEGQKLSKAEVTASTALRRLRQKVLEDHKSQNEARRVLAKAERASSSLSDRVTKLEIDKREAVAKLARLPRLEREIADFKRERHTKDATIESLKKQNADARKAANEEQKHAAEKALKEERQNAQSLRDDLANAKIEQELRDGRAQTQIKEVQEQLEKARQRHANVEAALRSEISTLEGRLEVLRERSEEVFSGTTNDSQAKLLRQVETLQSQYSVASENWQILESSLQSRLTGVEKERDDTAKAESEARKRARDNGSALRKLQDQLDDMSQRCQILEHDIAGHQKTSQQNEKKVLELGGLLEDEKRNSERERTSWQATLKMKLEEERSKWEAQSPKLHPTEAALQNLSSPPPSNFRRTSGLDTPGLSTRRSRGSELNISGLDRPMSSRRTSAMFGREINGFTSPMHAPLETPSIHTVDHEEQAEAASSPHRTINDMLSVQTTSAGPSVQLVERMSAAVRRLETEKAGINEELARLSGQRDEARKEVVNLMREVDQKRSIEKRLVSVEERFEDINGRYQTTLEMLGERSERVEELEADVADLKKIYRDLVDRSTK